jgi:hypothetical protein
VKKIDFIKVLGIAMAVVLVVFGGIENMWRTVKTVLSVKN